MRSIIIEDEAIAVQVLKGLLSEVAPGVQVVATLGSVGEAVEWIRSHELPDVAFVDIHLADGSSFAIFDECEFDCPVIFTTAYDQYAIKAFEVNSIGYLLKPIDKEKLRRAVAKIKIGQKEDNSQLIERLMNSMRSLNVTYRQNILISYQDKLLPIPVSAIAFFYVDGRQVTATTMTGKEYRVDMTLDELQEQLSPVSFFRVNRQYIIQHVAVKELTQWFSGKYVLGLSVNTPEKIVVPKAKVTPIKDWLSKGE